MIKVNGKEVVFESTLLVQDEQEAEVSAEIDGWNFKLIMSFHPNLEGESKVRSDIGGDHLRLFFDNWKNSLGTALTSPLAVGTTHVGRTVFLMVFHHRIGATNRVDIQLTAGVRND